MTPDALRTLASIASTTTDELHANSKLESQKGKSTDLHTALCYRVCSHAFMTFARVLAEAANTAKPLRQDESSYLRKFK